MSDGDVTSDRAEWTRTVGRKRRSTAPQNVRPEAANGDGEQIKDWIVDQNLKPGDWLPGKRNLIVRLSAGKIANA
jgi:hypothetical protein